MPENIAYVKNNVTGIAADCGGACSCATFHVFVDEGSRELIGISSGYELAMLEFAQNPEPGSRLSYQIKISEELDGLIVRLPESQH